VSAHPRRLLAAAVISLTPRVPALAFDDSEFCVAAQQFTVAENKDVGLWIDRTTRNAGMTVTCETRTVEFKRFTYALSSSMSSAWKEHKAAEWNARHCNNPIWSAAIRSGWKILLTTTSIDRKSASIIAECK
jgi:hypothetical protein